MNTGTINAPRTKKAPLAKSSIGDVGARKGDRAKKLKARTCVFSIEGLVAEGQGNVTRIAILMIMGEDTTKKWSPSDMTEELRARGHVINGAAATLGGVSYHYRTLLGSGWIDRSGVKRVRGAIENFYLLDSRRV